MIAVKLTRHFLFIVMTLLIGTGLMSVSDVARATCTVSTDSIQLKMPSTIFDDIPTIPLGQAIPVGGWREADLTLATCTAAETDDVYIVAHPSVSGWNDLQNWEGHDGVPRQYYVNPVSTDPLSGDFDNNPPTLGIIAEFANYANTTILPMAGGDDLLDVGTGPGNALIVHMYYEFVALKATTPSGNPISVQPGYVGTYPSGTWDWKISSESLLDWGERDSNFAALIAKTYVLQAKTCTINDTNVNLGMWDETEIPKFGASLSPLHPWKDVSLKVSNCNANGISMTFRGGLVTPDKGFSTSFPNSNLEVMLQQTRSNGHILTPPFSIVNGSASGVYFSCDATPANDCSPDSDLSTSTALQANLFTSDGSIPTATGTGSATITVDVTYR